MQDAQEVLSLERLDPNLSLSELVSNARELADFLEAKSAPYPIDFIRPTLTYVLETDELVGTHDYSLQLELSRSIIAGFRLAVGTGSDLPIEQYRRSITFRLFRFLIQFFSPLKDEKCDGFEDRTGLLRIANEISLFVLVKDTTLCAEVFDALIDIEQQDAVSAVVKMVNDCDRLPTPIVYGICERIKTESKPILEFVKSLQSARREELVQGIKGFMKGESAIQMLTTVDEVLDIEPPVLVGYIEADLGNEDDATRTAAIVLATKALLKPNFHPTSWILYSMIIARHIDKLAKIRAVVVDFAFGVLRKLDGISSVGMSKIDAEIFEATRTRLTDEIWDAAKDRIIDASNEVRLAVMKNLMRLDVSSIKLDYKVIAIRLKDKTREVRACCLKLMLAIYESNPDGLDWLIGSLISLYPRIRDIALYGFSCVNANHSLVAVAEQLSDRRPLLAMLKDIREFREHLQNYKDAESQAILGKYVPIKNLQKIMQSMPKSFLKQALDGKKRKAAYKQLKLKIPDKMKEKSSDDIAKLVIGLYQPCPMDVDELISCTNLGVVSDLASVYAHDLKADVPRLLESVSESVLVIMSSMKRTDISSIDRERILSALLPMTDRKAVHRELALKAFGCVYRPEFSSLLDQIKFSKDEVALKIQFYARLKTVPRNLLHRLRMLITDVDLQTAKSALKLACLDPGEEAISIHLKCIDVYPAEAFRSYLSIVHRCGRWNTPDIFRKFAGVMQSAECEVRTSALAALTDALKLDTTPIQYLALYALSATDPYEPNVTGAAKQLEAAISYRHAILREIGEFRAPIAPESAIPFLVHILSHHDDFESDSPELKTFAVYLRFFIGPLCADTTDVDGILNAFLNLSLLEDVNDDYTDNMIRLCDLASAIVKEEVGGRDWGTPRDIPFEYSTRYYRPASNKLRVKQLLRQRQVDSPRIPKTKAKLLRAGMSPKPKRLSKRPVNLMQLDDDEPAAPRTRKQPQSAPATPIRRQGVSSPTTPIRSRRHNQ